MAYLNQTRIRSLNVEVLVISDIIEPNGQQQSKHILSYKQSGSRKTILLLRKNGKLGIKYALLYGVTSLMLGHRKRRFQSKISPNDFPVCREEKARFEMNTEGK